ncbi:MAG: outer membrane protein assembly factor BamB family protein [Planctomycetota bacterium]|jgi:outer membrane protein assembly factor BamB
MLPSLFLRPGVVCALLLVAGCEDGGAQPEQPRQDEPTSKPTSSPASQKGVAHDWPLYRGNPALEGVAPGALGKDFELAWSFATGDAILSSPVVANGTVYIGSSDQSVYAVDIANGKKTWSFPTDDIVDAPPLVLDGRVYIGSADAFFYALDAKDGGLVWKFETGDKIVGAANYARLADGSLRILVGSHDNNLYCFDAGGKKLWAYETGNFVNAAAAIYGDRAVFGGCDAVLHVVSIKTGKKLEQVELGPGCHVANAGAIVDKRAYIGHYGNEFLCVDLVTNEVVWAYPSRKAFFSSPAIAKDRLVFGGRDRQLHCVARSDGGPIWTFPTRRKIDSSPVICGDKVVFGSGDGRLYIVNLSDGKEVFQYEIGRPVFSSPAVVGGMIFVGASDNRLYAFRPR